MAAQATWRTFKAGSAVRRRYSTVRKRNHTERAGGLVGGGTLSQPNCVAPIDGAARSAQQDFDHLPGRPEGDQLGITLPASSGAAFSEREQASLARLHSGRAAVRYLEFQSVAIAWSLPTYAAQPISSRLAVVT